MTDQNNALLTGAENFLGVSLKAPEAPVAPTYNPGTNDFSDEEKIRRQARSTVAARNLFSTDISKLDDDAVSGLYQATTKALFDIDDKDGTVAFGKRAGDARSNVEMLRRFCKGEYSLIRDPEYDAYSKMTEEEKFQYALEKETMTNKIGSFLKGERNAPIGEMAGLVTSAIAPFTQFGPIAASNPKKMVDYAKEIIRKSDYEKMTPEEQAAYRNDVIDDYEKKISKRQTLATFLAMKDGLSDRASMLLAKAYNTGNVDVDAMESLNPQERDRAYTALSIMRGDQKKGHLLGIPTDFTDDTNWNRVQLGLYGFQQSLLSLATDTYDVGKSAVKWAYANTLLDGEERKRFIAKWDAQARAETALEQGLPEAEGLFGQGFQAIMENAHWFIPYGLIGKGGKLMRASAGIAEDAKWYKNLGFTLTPWKYFGKNEKALVELNAAGKAVKEAEHAKTLASLQTLDAITAPGRWTEGNVLLARQMATIEYYTKGLQDAQKAVKAAKVSGYSGLAMKAAGEASAFSSFANEYVANCDAAGISRQDSVPMAAAIGWLNARIESIYVPGLESGLTKTEVKSLMFSSLLQAIRSDGMAGARKWLGNRVSYGLREGAKVALSEGAIEEPLQQIVTEHGKAIAETSQKLRENGQGQLADQLTAYWNAIKTTAANDLNTYIDTAMEMVPSSIGFGVMTIGNQTRRQHLENAYRRHANRVKYAEAVKEAEKNGQPIPSAPTMFSEGEGGRIVFNADGLDYDGGVADMVAHAVGVQNAVREYWDGTNAKEGSAQYAADPNGFMKAVTAARGVWKNGSGDVIAKIADAAQVDHKTAELMADYFAAESQAELGSPNVRNFVAHDLSAVDFSEETLKKVLPGYVPGSFVRDDAQGLCAGKVTLPNGEEKTIAYVYGDISERLMEMADKQSKLDSELGKSHDARVESGTEEGKLWAEMDEADRYAYALKGVNALSTGSGFFRVTGKDGKEIDVNADDVIYLSNGEFGKVGYGPMATMGTVRHETWHSIWRFTSSELSTDEKQKLAKTLDVDVTNENWENKLDEAMAYQFEQYASGNYVSHKVDGIVSRFIDSATGKMIRQLARIGFADEIKNPKTGKGYELADFYDAVIRGELGTGRLGYVQTEAPTAEAPMATKQTSRQTNELPVEVSPEETAAVETAAAQEAEKAGQTEAPAPASAPAVQVEYTLENPADASVPNARFYRISAGDGVTLVGELVVSDASELKTSYKGNLADAKLQNRGETEEGRALVEKIAGSPDPLQVGTVQPRANNGFIWSTSSGDVFVGNTRTTGITEAYQRGNGDAVEAHMREEAAKRGIEIPSGVKNPVVHFVLRKIESDGAKADIYDVVRMTNESVNRGMNKYEQAKNDADVMVKFNIVPGIVLDQNGNIEAGKSAYAIGAFRKLTGAQGLVDETQKDEPLSEEGQERLKNAVLASLLKDANPALLAKIVSQSEHLDMENEKAALMRSAAELMRLAKAKPQYDLRQAIAEALEYYTEWRYRDEKLRAEADKDRRTWTEKTADGKRKRGLTWDAYMGQGDMFRTPSPEAKIIGDALAAGRELRSFDKEDNESSAGKNRMQKLLDEYLADYIKNANAANTETEDLLGTPPPSAIDILVLQRNNNGKPRFSTVAAKRLKTESNLRRKDLIAVHNLRSNAIKSVAEMGGFAMPSIAVVKDAEGHKEFGDVTVLFDKETIDPKKNRQNALYSHDAWTPTFPEIFNKIDEKGISKTNERLVGTIPENVKNVIKGEGYKLAYTDGIHDAFDHAEDAADAYARNILMKTAYLVAKGEKVEPVLRDKTYLKNVHMRLELIGENGLKKLHERLGKKLIEIYEGPGSESVKKYEELAPEIEEIVKDAVWERDFKDDPKVIKGGYTKEQCVGNYFTDNHLNWAEISDIAESVYKYDEDLKNGKLGEKIPDEWKTKDAISKRVDEKDPEYRAWINAQYENPILGKGVYNGKERFTTSGNRRSWEALHNPATLDNIIKAMKKTQRANGAGILGRNPFGVAVKKFKSIKDLVENEDILKPLTRDEEGKIREELGNRLSEVLTEYQDTQKSPDDNQFIARDRALEMMFDAYEEGRGGFTAMKALLNGWGYSADDDLVQRIKNVFDDMSVMSTNYFEAKPQRAVRFDEMKAWIVPDTISKENRKYLEDNGQRIFTYKEKDEEDRLRAVNEAANRLDTRFSTVIDKNIDEMLSKFDEAKGKSKEKIFKEYSHDQKVVAVLPEDIELPPELKVERPEVLSAQNFLLDHVHNHKHEIEYGKSDVKRVLKLIDPKNEMRVVPQRQSSSLAFIGENPKGGWDCIVIAPRRGEFYILKTLFGQKRKPYQSKAKIRYSSSGSSGRNEAVGSLLRGPLASIRDVNQTVDIVPQSKRNGQLRPSTVRPQTLGAAYPRLDKLSDTQLIAAAVASKMVFGKRGKLKNRYANVNEIQRYIKALNPGLGNLEVSRKTLEVTKAVNEIGGRMKEDLAKGVSESQILQHLPDRMKDVFEGEMTTEARRGANIGAYQTRAAQKLEEKAAKIVEDAVAVQSGVETALLENAYGIDFSQTLMTLDENPYLKKDGNGNFLPLPGTGSGFEENGSAPTAKNEIEVSKAIKKAVDEIVAKSANQLKEEGEAKAQRQTNAQTGETKESEGDLGNLTEGDIAAIATKRAGVDLKNPRQLALFIAELSRRWWVKKHGLAEDAEAFRDRVALQFLRKTAANIYEKLVREITYSQSRDAATQAINGFQNTPTLNGLLREMTYVGQLVNAKKIRETQQQMCERLDQLLRENFGAVGRFKADREELRRKVSAEMELRARYTRHAMWLTPNAAGEEAQRLRDELDMVAVNFETNEHDAEHSRVFEENLRKLNILREFGGLRYKPLADIEKALGYWENALAGETDAIVRANYERDVRTKKAAELLARAFHNPKQKYAREGGLLSSLGDYIQGHMSFTHLLRDMMRYASEEDAAQAEKIVQYLELEIQKAGTRSTSEQRKHAGNLASVVQKLYGRDFSKVLAEFAKEDARFAPFMGEKDGKRIQPTKGRAIQLMVSLLQVGHQVEVEDPNDPKKTVMQWVGGYHDNIVKYHREGQAEQIAALLTPADLNLVKWIGQWYDANRKELSDECQALFGMGVYAETWNYFPVKMLLEKQGLEKGESVGWTIFPKALTPRVKNERDFDTSADFLQIFMSRMEEAAQWKAHAKLGLELRGIFGRTELQNAVCASHGNKANALMLGFITDTLAGHGAYDRSPAGVEYYSDMIRGWAALGALGGNVGVMFKQTTSIPAFGFEIGMVDTAKHMMTAFSPDGVAAMRKIFDSEERKNRWNTGNTEAVKNALATEKAGALKKLLQASMITNKLGDCVPGLVIGQGIYRDCLKRGMSEEDAMAYTWMLIERTQQSSRIENQTSFQRRAKLGRIIYQFLSTQQQYLQYEARAIRNVMANPSILTKEGRKRWSELGRAAVLNHFILSSAYFWMGQLYKSWLGQEPPEDELKDWTISCLLGPYGALFCAGFTCTDALNEWIKGPKYGGGSSVPSLSWAGNIIVRDPIKIISTAMDEDKTFDDVIDEAAKFAADSNALFRDLRKIYRWRIKEEPQ